MTAIESGQSRGLVSPGDWCSINQLLQLLNQYLDDENFPAWLDMFGSNGRYEISAYSHELRRMMTWLDNDVDEMRSLLDALPNHLRDPGYLTRVVSLRSVSATEDGFSSRATVQVYRTDVHGESRLFALGDYLDEWNGRLNGYPRLARRAVELKTRTLATGTHVPL